MKKILMLCAALAFALRASGQTTCQPPPLEVPAIPTAQSNLPNTLPGVVIERWHFDAQHKTLTLRLVNHSHSDVTAFNISIAEKYADGSTNPSSAEGIPHNLQDHQIMEDMLNLMNQPDRKAFAAGTTHDYVMYGEQKYIADIQAVVDVVAYADGSADVLDNDPAFRNLVAETTGRLRAMEKGNEVAKRVLSDPMVSHPISASLNEMLPFTESLKNQRPSLRPASGAKTIYSSAACSARFEQAKSSTSAGCVSRSRCFGTTTSS